MNFEIYCDENHPELFTSKNSTAHYLMIGSLWLPTELRSEIKDKIWALREKHNAWVEIKWCKVSKGKLPFYLELVELFQSYGQELRFRCIAVDHKSFDSRWHKNDNELGFYKFYYQLLHHWIADFNKYGIFCDIKTNRNLKRLLVLKDCLNKANLSASIYQVQALPSRSVVLMQLTDLLLGMSSSRLNKTLRVGSAKEQLVKRFEQYRGGELAPTPRTENKFNIFKINLQGGW
jgi:hypothetical protein